MGRSVRPRWAALGAMLVLGCGVFASPAAASEPEDKDSIIERLQGQELTAEEQNELNIFLAVERKHLAYIEAVDEAVSPGVGIAEDGTAIIRIYQGEKPDTVQKALSELGVTATLLPSQFTKDAYDGLYATLIAYPLTIDQGFGHAYDAVNDVISAGGNVPADAFANYLGDRWSLVEYTYAEGGGRDFRLSDNASRSGEAGSWALPAPAPLPSRCSSLARSAW